MPRIVVVLSVFAVLFAAALTACGSDDSGGSNTSDQAAATSAATAAAPDTTAAPAPAATTAAPAATTPAPAPAPAPKLSKTKVVAICHQTFDPYIAALRRINQAVTGDPNYKQYAARTKALGARYQTLKTAGIPSTTCQHQVNGTIAAAYMTHVNAAATWEQCRERDDCNRTMSALKKQWHVADKATDDAVKAFHNVNPS